MTEAETSEVSTIDGSPDRLNDLQGKLAAAEKSLLEAREALSAAERKREIERELSRHGAIDVETASVVVEAALSKMEKPDANAAIAELKRGKPFLFRSLPRASAMSGVPEESSALDQAAAEARTSGDRRALLRYLRVRRGG